MGLGSLGHTCSVRNRPDFHRACPVIEDSEGSTTSEARILALDETTTKRRAF